MVQAVEAGTGPTVSSCLDHHHPSAPAEICWTEPVQARQRDEQMRQSRPLEVSRRRGIRDPHCHLPSTNEL